MAALFSFVVPKLPAVLINFILVDLELGQSLRLLCRTTWQSYVRAPYHLSTESKHFPHEFNIILESKKVH